MRTALFIMLLLASLMMATSVAGQTAGPKPGSRVDPAGGEIERLRADNERLRRERDGYYHDLSSGETRASAELKLLAAQLSKDVREDIYDMVVRLLWMLGILIAVATAGGFWKLSDIISSRIDSRIADRERDIQRLREQVIDALVNFKGEAAEAVKELMSQRQSVASETQSALLEIRSKRLAVVEAVDASGQMSTVIQAKPLQPIVDDWFGTLPAGFVGIAGSRFDEFGADASPTAGVHMGAFSHYFQKALLDPLADVDGDGRVSLQEAVAAARPSLTKTGFQQNPVIVGPGSEVALFGLKPVSKRQRPSRRILAVLVGINEYVFAGNPHTLRGAVNDVTSMHGMLQDQKHLLASAVLAHLAIDHDATHSRLETELGWLRKTATPTDLVFFYYSGLTVRIKAKQGRKSAMNEDKALVPFNFEDDESRLLRVPDLVTALGEVAGEYKVLIVDG